MTMSRRRFLELAPVHSTLLAACGWPAAAAAANCPNVVFILADDMGYGDLACQNPESKVSTPNLDRLAGQGIRFTDAHSPSAVCTPTRYGILTGRYCWRTRLKRSVLWPWDRPLIEPGRLTVPKLLKQQGYHTACIGKWHLGWDWPTEDGVTLANEDTGERVDFSRPIGGGPLAAGFDYYFGDDVPNFPPYTFIENDRVTAIPTELKPKGMFGHAGVMQEGWELDAVMPAITDRAAGYVRERAKTDEPFFLYFALTAPHTPIAPAAEFRGTTEAGRYGDYVHQVDAAVGEVMKALEETGQADNTLLVFTSDNGSPCRDGSNMCGPTRSVLKYGHDPSRPWRGMKADAWEGGHRVPFIVRWPGQAPAGAVSDEPILHTDFMATVAALLETPLPQNAAEDSYNLLPLFRGGKPDRPVREALVLHSGSGLFCVRQGEWKLIRGLGPGGFSGPARKPGPGEPEGQLYNLRNDPKEQSNVYASHPEVVARLRALLERYKETGRSR